VRKEKKRKGKGTVSIPKAQKKKRFESYQPAQRRKGREGAGGRCETRGKRSNKIPNQWKSKLGSENGHQRENEGRSKPKKL